MTTRRDLKRKRHRSRNSVDQQEIDVGRTRIARRDREARPIRAAAIHRTRQSVSRAFSREAARDEAFDMAAIAQSVFMLGLCVQHEPPRPCRAAWRQCPLLRTERHRAGPLEEHAPAIDFTFLRPRFWPANAGRISSLGNCFAASRHTRPSLKRYVESRARLAASSSFRNGFVSRGRPGAIPSFSA